MPAKRRSGLPLSSVELFWQRLQTKIRLSCSPSSLSSTLSAEVIVRPNSPRRLSPLDQPAFGRADLHDVFFRSPRPFGEDALTGVLHCSLDWNRNEPKGQRE